MVAQTNGKIYKIQDIGGNKTYYGSTNKKYLSQRMDTQRGNYKSWKKGKHNHIRCFDIFEEYGVENCVIILVEAYPCNSKEELRAREAHYIQSMECVNKNIPGRTKKQYYENHKEQISEYQKAYNEKHSDEIAEYRWDYYAKNRDKILKQQKERNQLKKLKPELIDDHEVVATLDDQNNIITAFDV